MPLPANLRLLIITGNPGAGKSSLADTLEAKLKADWTFVRGDSYIPEVFRRYPGQRWSAIRKFLVPISAEGVQKAWANGPGVVYEGVVLTQAEVQVLASAIGLNYPSPAIAVLNLCCSADEVVARRLMVNWDAFPVPRTAAEKTIKERAIRDHHRFHTPGPIPGAYTLPTDGKSTDQVFTEVVRWLARRRTDSSGDGA